MKGFFAGAREPCNPVDHDGFPVFVHSIIFKACLDDIFLKLPYVLTRPYLGHPVASGLGLKHIVFMQLFPIKNEKVGENRVIQKLC